MKKKLTLLDQKIINRVQAVEQQVPADLEKMCLDALESQVPEPAVPLTPKKRRFAYYGTMAAAATFVLVVLMMVFYLFYQQTSPTATPVVEAGEVCLQDTFVEDQQATTYVMNASDPDMTIFWVEKIDNDDE